MRVAYNHDIHPARLSQALVPRRGPNRIAGPGLCGVRYPRPAYYPGANHHLPTAVGARPYRSSAAWRGRGDLRARMSLPSPTVSVLVRLFERVACYIDGFNLYHGLQSDERCKHHRWLDLWSFCSSLMEKGEILGRVVYCTAVPDWDRGKHDRHRTYIAALESRGVTVVEGRFQPDAVACRATCQELWNAYNEKMTDVNLATTMFIDAVADRFDRAYLITGDSDQVPTIKALAAFDRPRPVTVVFPPKRTSEHLRQIADQNRRLGWKSFRSHQLPDTIRLDSGRTIRRPARWDPPAP